MYGRFIGFTLSRNVYPSRPATARVYPSNHISSSSTHPDIQDPNLVDDIRPDRGPAGSTSSGADDRVNVVRSSTTPPSSASKGDEDLGDMASFVADAAKQGVVKAMETGLDIGEMAKKTLDNVFDATKETTHRVKEAVAGDPEEENEVPPTDHFVDDLREKEIIVL